MEADRIIGRYCVTGAIAALNYVEVASTEDIDILVAFDEGQATASLGLVTLGPILKYLRKRGYTEFRAEGLVIEGWPVQFLPVADALDAEMLDSSIEVRIDSANGAVRTRLISPHHLVAKALSVGRPKDHSRALQFLAEAELDVGALCLVLERHGLQQKLSALCNLAGLPNPCMLLSQP